MSDLFPLTLKAVTVRRKGRQILGPVDLTIGAQGLTMIVGPNGSGKSTLLRAMHGVERISQGEVNWAAEAAVARARQAFVFQTPIMLRRSVADNLLYPLALSGQSRNGAQAAVTDWCDRIGLAGQEQTAATRLSGGERQKLAVARALITKPDVLFLDEPCASLDGRATREIEALLLAAQAAGTRILMATHNMGQARRLATDVIFLLRGQIHEAGKAETVFAAPRTPELQTFLRGDILE